MNEDIKKLAKFIDRKIMESEERILVRFDEILEELAGEEEEDLETEEQDEFEEESPEEKKNEFDELEVPSPPDYAGRRKVSIEPPPPPPKKGIFGGVKKEKPKKTQEDIDSGDF